MLRNYSLAFVRLSEQYLKENRGADALRVARESFHIYTPDPDIRMLLYTIFRDHGPRESVNLLIEDELRRLPRDNIQAATGIGMLFLQFELSEAAVRVFRELSAAHENDSEVWRLYTAALFQSGDYSGALDAANRLQTLVPGDSQAKEILQIIERKLAEPSSPDTLTSRNAP
jgi:Flp pilus assembly protein TadD